MRLSKLSSKYVISIHDGEILGKIHDIEIDLNHFQVNAFCIKKKKGFFSELFSFSSKESSVVVNVQQVISVGTDVVILDYNKQGKKTRQKENM